MDVLLTGAGGYIGSRVGRALDLAGVGWRPLEGRLEALEPGATRADLVLHCAGALRNRPDQQESANAIGTARLVASLRRPARVVFVSTRSVYPLEGHLPVDESTAPAPFDEYGRTKLAAEEALRSSTHEVAVLRVSGVFGHPERTGAFIDRAVDLALAGHPIPLAVPDRAEDHVAVDWLARAMVHAGTTEAAWGRVLNLGGPSRSLAGIVAALGRAVERATGRAIEVAPTPIPVPRTPLLDSGRAMSLLGLPPHPADEGTFSSMVAHRRG